MAGSRSIMIALVSTLMLVCILFAGVHATASAPKFRASLTTLTMGDLPDLEAEQPTTLDDVVEDAPTLGSLVNEMAPKATGAPSEAELTSFQQFLAATTPAARSMDIASDGDWSFSGSDDTSDAIGYTARTLRSIGVDGKAILSLVIESISEENINMLIELQDTMGVDVADDINIMGLTTAQLPKTVSFESLTDNVELSLEITSYHSSGAASSINPSIIQHTSSQWTFAIVPTVTGSSFTYAINVGSNAPSTFKYLVASASASAPSVATILSTGVTQSFTDEDVQQGDAVTITSTVSSYGSYVFYIAYVREIGGVSVAIATQQSINYVNPCDSSPCQHSGVCTPTGAITYTCDCSAIDYEGSQCQTKIDNCASTPCHNGATCIDGVRSHTCTCANGFSGASCDTENFCTTGNVVCQNGGTCSYNTTAAKCTCATGFTGAHCEININDCATSPCQNGGTCTDGINSYTCTCATGFTGYNCQATTSIKCLAAPCLNGGSCYNTTASPYYFCLCNSNYTGDTCATKITTTGPTRPSASVRVVQMLSVITALTPADYPAFKNSFATIVISALNVSMSRFAWVYFGLRRTTTTASHSFDTLATAMEASYDLLAPTNTSSGGSDSESAAELLATLNGHSANITSQLSVELIVLLGTEITETLKSCSDGSETTGDCPLEVESSTGTTSSYQNGSTSNSTWIALGVSVGVFFVILAGILCYCQRKRPAQVSESYDANGNQLLGGSGDLQGPWDDAPPATFVEMSRPDQILSQS